MEIETIWVVNLEDDFPIYSPYPTSTLSTEQSRNTAHCCCLSPCRAASTCAPYTPSQSGSVARSAAPGEPERRWSRPEFSRYSHANHSRKQHKTKYSCDQNVRFWTTLLWRHRCEKKQKGPIIWGAAVSLVFVMGSTSVDQAVRLVRQAVLQDSKRNYGEAARCYREAITSFRELRHSRASSKRLQELLDTKLGEFALLHHY